MSLIVSFVLGVFGDIRALTMTLSPSSVRSWKVALAGLVTPCQALLEVSQLGLARSFTLA